MSWPASLAPKHSTSHAEEQAGHLSLLPIPLEMNQPQSGISPIKETPAGQPSEDIDTLREFHLENIRLHQEIDDAIRCYAGLAWQVSNTSWSRSIPDQACESGTTDTRISLRRKRAATSVRDLALSRSPDRLIAEIEEYLEPVSPLDQDFQLWARREKICDIVSSASNCRSNVQVTEAAPTTQFASGTGAFKNFQITYPAKARRQSDPISPRTLATGATTASYAVREIRPWRIRLRSAIRSFSSHSRS